MKMFSFVSSLISRAYSLIQKIQIQPINNTVRAQTKGPNPNSLGSKIYSLGDPNVSASAVLDHYIREGNSTDKWELKRIINELSHWKKFKHALEVSMWMTNKGNFPIDPYDVSVRMKLINRVFGLEQVEHYFNKIPQNLKDNRVYLALLNCHSIAKRVDKAESVMQKARDLGYASKPIWYNLMMDLHGKLGNTVKVSELLAEMEAKGIPYDQFTYSVCLSASAAASDSVKMDKILTMMESVPTYSIHWETYAVAVKGYMRMGLFCKALPILDKLEMRLDASMESRNLSVFLMNLYSETGMKEDVYRVWNLYKERGKPYNKVYISMMRSLMKLDDVEGAEKIFAEWELSGLPFDFRVPNFLIDSYCENGYMDKAETLINKGISKGVDPHVLTWCHMAGGYLQKNQVPKAIAALKEAVATCPPELASLKDSLMSCLEHLESGDCFGKGKELLKCLKTRGIFNEAVPSETLGFIRDEFGRFHI